MMNVTSFRGNLRLIRNTILWNNFIFKYKKSTYEYFSIKEIICIINFYSNLLNK